jgi:glutamate 5-kinase
MNSETHFRQRLGASQRWVIKIGSALLTDEGRGLDMAAIAGWVAQIAALRKQHTEVVLVSSGAVAEGMKRLNWSERPTEVYKLQAAAAVGQMGMIQTYESCFQQHGIHTAQVLLTHEDLASRERYLNARSTLRTLLELGVVPVINENDTVATDEIRLGDNDTLAGLVSNLVEADVLIILTDQQGLFARDPRLDPSAPLITFGQAGDPELEAMASGKGGKFGRGGMLTKLKAATRAGRSGAATLIVSGRITDVLMKISQGISVGTLLYSPEAPLAARKQWLASHLKVHGELHLDDGAVSVLRHGGKSLLAIGVTAVVGQFTRGDMVTCLAPDGTEVARGFVNYPAEETQKILRQPSDKIEQILGYVDEPELIHRDNLVLV